MSQTQEPVSCLVR